MLPYVISYKKFRSNTEFHQRIPRSAKENHSSYFRQKTETECAVIYYKSIIKLNDEIRQIRETKCVLPCFDLRVTLNKKKIHVN